MKYAQMHLTVAESLDEQLTNIELSLSRIENVVNAAIERPGDTGEKPSVKSGIDKAERLATFAKLIADHLSDK